MSHAAWETLCDLAEQPHCPPYADLMRRDVLGEMLFCQIATIDLTTRWPTLRITGFGMREYQRIN